MGLLGIDIGGTGIKGAPVDVSTGTLTADRLRIETPQPATPDAVAKVVAEVVGSFDAVGACGATFPAVVRDGRARTAANVDAAWIGEDIARRFEDATGRTFIVLNDADAAGLAEVRFGAGAGRKGVVMVVTLGTGIGSALFVDGKLVPNTELGHLEMGGKDAEKYAAESVRERKELSWKQWGKRVGEYLGYVERLFSPDLFIIGGGVSKKSDRYFQYFDLSTEVVPAQLLNEAGIVGAALAAAGAHMEMDRPKPKRRAAKKAPATTPAAEVPAVEVVVTP
ncbi:MAG: polyphosphate--glucose phosphotransferase [Acidimicrobiales bacterium]